MKVEYFKAAKQTNRYNENQKVWVRYNYGNSLEVFFKWRGRGRWVSGTQDKYSPCVGEIKAIDVSQSFADRIHGSNDAGHWVAE